MTLSIQLDDLLDYTDWQRGLWLELVRKEPREILKTDCGPNGDGRLNTVGDVIRHIFSAETRYVDRLTGRTLSDASNIPADDAEALFGFGSRSRAAFRAFLSEFPAAKLDVPEQHNIAGHSITLTPRKILVHTVIHEIRHWAQIATLLRLRGVTAGFQDFMFSPASFPRDR